ncbi:nucleoporin NUP35 [Nilaparvata lugens]|uniref:nucleoporin NUP35 n=1 Tax=Nilaparvata lugens TaxID=108931 RepID=UPI00193E2A6F|nr:nucleoporin NUP35 [Nilaparvata lugens]XP_039295580.1 nucleoporin NUP35 [Nilaparvata lugens]
MEPMTLGSPIGSPSSPSGGGGGGNSGGGGGSSFLPAFLMGEANTSASSLANPHSPHPHSPQKTPRQVTFSTPRLQANTPQKPDGSRPSVFEPRTRSLHVTQSEKSGGIPTVGLFDTLDTSSVPQSPLMNITNTLNTSITQLASQSSTQQQQDTPDRNTGVTADHWVTVFGFPPSAATTVLAQFSQLGQLQQHVTPPKGNWMHLRYYSKMEARRAYSYNGKVFGGSVMVGVVPCKDPSIVKDLLPSVPSSPVTLGRRLMSPDVGTPMNQSSHWDNSYVGPSPRARPLNRTPHPDTEVICQQNTPTKSSSVVSRTFEYFLGW